MKHDVRDALRAAKDTLSYMEGQIEEAKQMIAMIEAESKTDPEGTDAWMRTAGAADRVLDQLDRGTHIHTGSTGHMHFRSARHRLLGLITKEA